MIEYVSGDILEDHSQVLVNPVNCVGVMGKGLALQFKNSYPENFDLYKLYCQSKALKPGKTFVWQRDKKKWIFNVATKLHWKESSKIDWIESALSDINRLCLALNVESVAIPRLGCGAGGLKWKEVLILVKRYCVLDLKYRVYSPCPV